MVDETTRRMREALRQRKAQGNAAPPPPPPRRPVPPPVPPTPWRPPGRPDSSPARAGSRTRSHLGLDPVTSLGHGLALVALLTLVLATPTWPGPGVSSRWTKPVDWAYRSSEHWPRPTEASLWLTRSEHYEDVRWKLLDHLFTHGHGFAGPWLYPALAVAVALLLRCFRLPTPVQAVLGWASGLFGALAMTALVPGALVLWTATLVFVLVSVPLVVWRGR
jgi:hypothetical protein